MRSNAFFASIDTRRPKVLSSTGENDTAMQTITLTNDAKLAKAFDLPRGVTALVGGGGKTTLLMRLVRELADSGARVIVSTTTHIFPPEGIRTLTEATAQETKAALEQAHIVCLGKPDGAGKLTAPDLPVSRMAELADYVLLEADGAKRLPLKAPAEHEPVIPKETRLVIAVAGLSGIGRPISEAAFRPERYASLCGKQPDERVTARDVALILAHTNGQRKGVSDGMRFAVLLNQADDAALIRAAHETADELEQYAVERAVIASLHNG